VFRRADGHAASPATALHCTVAEARMFPEDPAAIARKLTELKMEHRDLDAAISRLALDVGCDELHLTRLKKRKLKLKDMISYLENKLIPDLDA
jgi:hypothetical protein